MYFLTLGKNKVSVSQYTLSTRYVSPVQGEARGNVVDGVVEADVTGPPLRAGTGTRRRSLYWHNRAHTSYGRSGGPRSRGGQESSCWWLCSVPDPSPKKEGKQERKNVRQTYIRKTNRT